MPRIRVRDGPNRGLVVEIGSKPLAIGRDTDCAIPVLDKGASRRHAEVFRVGELCFVRDLSRRNGTYVNEERVQEELLRENDRICIGNTILAFEGDADIEGGLRNITFTEGDEEKLGSTLELRLDDLAGLEEDSREAANLRAIHQLGRVLAGERSVETAREKALAFLADLVPADQAYLFARDERTGSFVPRARFERDPGAKALVSRTIIRRCLSEFRSILTTNAMSDERFKAKEAVVLKGIRAVICVPMVSHGELSGALYMSSARVAAPFVEEELELVTAAATLLGLTVESLETARRQRETLFSAMRALVSLGEVRDAEGRGHSVRVARYALATATQLGLAERDRMNVRLAALLHDVGKASVAEGALAGKDTRLMRRGEAGTRHAVIGAEVAESLAGAEGVPPAIRHHHERFDGAGYPDGLAGEAIPLAARIVAAADVLDHLVQTGGAGDARAPSGVAVELLSTKVGRELDPEVVRAVAGAYKAGLLARPGTKSDEFEAAPAK